MRLGALTSGFALVCVLACDTGTGVEPPTTATLVLRNARSDTIRAVLLAACSAADYGTNWLAPREEVLPGGERDFALETPGGQACFDAAFLTKDTVNDPTVVADRRSRLLASRGDTVIVRLVPGGQQTGGP